MRGGCGELVDPLGEAGLALVRRIEDRPRLGATEHHEILDRQHADGGEPAGTPREFEGDDPRVAGPERLQDTTGGDGVGDEPGRCLDGVELR